MLAQRRDHQSILWPAEWNIGPNPKAVARDPDQDAAILTWTSRFMDFMP
jgi:hypothetical protein